MRDYPHLRFRRHWEVSSTVFYQLGQCEATVSAISRMPLRPEYHRRLLEVSLIKGAQATTAIEGNTLSEEEIARVAEGQKLAPSKEYQEIEVRNVLDAMNRLLDEVTREQLESTITPDLIRRFHEFIGAGLGEHLDAIPGQLRQDPRVVGTYRCPDHRDVPQLMNQLCAWLKQEFHYTSGEQTFQEAVIEAIVAHVYLEWIHPFGDGNGRTGRLLEFYILLRAGLPDVASHILSNFYNQTRPEYYRQLDRAGKTRDLGSFIAYAVQGLRDGLRETLLTIQQSQYETAWRNYIYGRFAEEKYRKNIFKRQRRLILDMPTETWLTAEKLVLISPKVAAAYSSLSERTLQRDLQALQSMGLLLRKGNRFAANSGVLRHQMPHRLRKGPKASSV